MVFCLVAENYWGQEGQTCRSVGGGETPEEQHRQTRVCPWQHAGEIPQRRGVRGLSALHQHEGETDRREPRDPGQGETWRGTIDCIEGSH